MVEKRNIFDKKILFMFVLFYLLYQFFSQNLYMGVNLASASEIGGLLGSLGLTYASLIFYGTFLATKIRLLVNRQYGSKKNSLIILWAIFCFIFLISWSIGHFMGEKVVLFFYEL